MSNSIWSNFPPILSSLLIEIFEHSEDNGIDERIERIINRHLYCRSIQILSQNERIKENVEKFLLENNEMAFLHVQNLPVYSLIDFKFIDTFWNNGKLYGLSVERDVNTEDTMAILPNKKIILSLNSQTYHRLGIIGQQSILNRTKSYIPKYRIAIELDKPHFKADKRYYQRIYECLKRSRLSFNTILKWEPKISTNVSPNSLESYFLYLKKNQNDPILSKIVIQKSVPNFRTFQNIDEPIFDMGKLVKQNHEENIKAFIEWCCTQMAQVKCKTNDLEISTLNLDHPLRSSSNDNVYGVQINGFLTNSNILKLIQVLLESFLSKDEFNVNAVIVHGFEDSPQCWTGMNNEHYKNLSGENLYGDKPTSSTKPRGRVRHSTGRTGYKSLPKCEIQDINDSIDESSIFLKEDLNLIFESLKSLFIEDQKDMKRMTTILETLLSILNMNQSNYTDRKSTRDFIGELSSLNQLLLEIKNVLNNTNNFGVELFELQHLILKNFNGLMKITKNLDTPLFQDILEDMVDYLIQLKIVICKIKKESNSNRDILDTLNETCLLLLKCIYFISSKCSIQYNNLRKTNISGKFIGILRCFIFYGLNNYDLNLFSIHLYPSPLSQFVSKELSETNVKKRKNKIDEDEIFDNSSFISSPNFSTSEYSSSELDESFSSLELTTRRKLQNKKIYVKIRMFAYECLQALLIVFDIRTVFGFWSFLFPDSSSLLPNDTQFSLLRTISNDTSNRVRISALNFMFNFFDDGKQYVQVLVQDSIHKPSTAVTSSFTPLSVSLTLMIKELHKFFQYILLKETNSSVLILIYRVLSLIVSITPYNKLNDDILYPLFYQNSFLVDNKVTQIKNLSLAFYVKLFSLANIPKELEIWILENKIGCETINKVFKHCYEFIANQDYILLIIESIKLFISILKHHSFALKLFSMNLINFQIDSLCDISINVIEMEKAFNNSVLQNLMCKFIHTIGSFLKELVYDKNEQIFLNHQDKVLFIKQWYLKVFSSKIFQQALVNQSMIMVQHSSQITLINVISLIPDETFAQFDHKTRYNIISILVSLSKIDETIDEYPSEINNDENDLRVYTRSTSIRCLSIIQSFECCSEDLNLICDLIDICLDVLDKPNYFRKLPKKKQVFLLEHTLWALANICDCIKKNSLQTKIDEFLFYKIAMILRNLFNDISHYTDDILINLVRNAGIVLYLILYKQSLPKYDSFGVNNQDDSKPVFMEKLRPNFNFYQAVFDNIVNYLIEILAKKKSYKLQWNICIAFSYLFQLENFVQLCLKTQQTNLLERIFTILFQTFMTTINHKVQSYSIFTISSISRLELFQEHLQKLWCSTLKKFKDNLNIVPTHSKKSWLEKFIFSIERLYKEYVCYNHDDDSVYEIQTSLKQLLDFLSDESQIEHFDLDSEMKLKMNSLYNLLLNHKP